MYGYGSSGNVWGMIFGVLIGIIIVFLICRELVCWYWKINKIIVLMEEQNKLLTILTKGEKVDQPIENTSEKESIKSYVAVTPTKIFYERDINSSIVKDINIGDKVNFQYDCKEGEVLWYYVKTGRLEGWCKAEYLKEC